jgi:predicted enzyme related to lactoylglutathione lyase
VSSSNPIHVCDVTAALDWYARAFPKATRTKLAMPTFEFEYLDVDGVMLELVPADEKVSSGTSGSVVYWKVPDFDQTLAHFQSIGAMLYRGPGDIENGQRMCQVRDPWGNCIGLRG